MTDFTLHTPDTAPEAARPVLEGAKASLGFVPNLFATMAEAPALLNAYSQLGELLNQTSFSPTEQQVVLMTNNRLNGCDYCMAAHTTISQASGVPADVIDSLRAGTAIADPKLEALRQFAIVVNETRGWPQPSDLDAFFAAGYGQQQVLEVVLGTAFKVLSNYTNHVADTPLDAAFQPNAWNADDIAKAA
ncbi:MAG: carboxymuconolactone decarboxylase family protein [Pseudomonadota bacterium]